MKPIFTGVAIVVLLGGIVVTQGLYDSKKIKSPEIDFTPSPKLVKSFDLGLHSALASYLWLFKTRTELIKFLFLPKEMQETAYARYSRNLNLINELDPKYSAPYVFSVIALPGSKYAGGVQASVEIGMRGVADADPDWQIPFYLAVTYHLELKDNINAAKYFDIAGHTPSIPEPARRFSINYGIFKTVREQTKQIWQAIYETTDDETMRERAQVYVVHFTILDYLDAAIKKYKNMHGRYPKKLEDLVSKKIIPEIPRDPFGFEFTI